MKFGTDNTGPEVFSLTPLGLFYSLEFLGICSFLVSCLDIEGKKVVQIFMPSFMPLYLH